MNGVAVFLGIVLVAGALFGLFAAAANQPQTPYVDTYGNTPSLTANHTQAMIANTSAMPLTMGWGMILFLAVIVILIVVLIAWRASTGGGYSSRR
jgi:ABC-type antimicrobial peptide transport system permease subunit